MKKEKRSQVTIFVIIAIFIVIAVGVFFVLRNAPEQKILSPQDAQQAVQSKMSSCLENLSTQGIILAGRQAGYYRPVNYFPYSGEDSEPDAIQTTLPSIKIGYYLYNGENLMPSLETVQNEISAYVSDNIASCMGNFEQLTRQGYVIEKGQPSAQTLIFGKKTRVTLNYPITVKKESSTEISNSEAEINVRLGEVYNITKGFMDSQMLDKDNLCLNCLLEAKNNDFYTQIMLEQDNTVILIFTDLTLKLNDEHYDFIFANKYA